MSVLSSVRPEEPAWLWYPRVPAGELTLLFGDGGTGKSHVCLALAAALSLGRGLPGVEGTGQPAPSLIFTGEDSLGEVRRRLDRMEADVSHIYACGEPFGLDESGLRLVAQSVRDQKAELAVIDPVIAFMGKDLDCFRPNEVRSILAPLADIAHETGVALVLVTHVTKGGAVRAKHRAMGSADFTNAARSALLCGSDPDTPEHCALVHVKANLGPLAEPLGYTMAGGRFAWTGHTDLTASRVLAPEAEEGQRGVSDAAAAIIEEMCGTEAKASEVIAQGEAEGVSKRTIQRVAARLCDKRRVGVGTSSQVVYWTLRQQPQPTP